MKLFVVGFALLAAACAIEVLPSSEYLPPIEQGISEIEPLLSGGLSGGLADDGYRYKTVRRFRVRRRRDVSELPSSEYLPPVPVQQQVSVPQVSIPQLPVQQVGSISSIGVPSNEYLAPIGPSPQVAQVSSGVLADDGYRYRTVKRYRLRHRRDVSELPSSEYLPPVQQQVSISQLPVQQLGSISSIGVPSNEYLAPIGPSAQIAQVSSGVLADDGYRYRTVKRFRSRHRRDVSELPSSEYLPPVPQQVSVSQLSVQPQVSVSQLPVQQLGSVSSIGVPSNEYLAPIGPSAQVAQVSSGVLADDGYRYRTVKRYRLRHRRSVSELPSVEYLPPVGQIGLQQLPIQQISSLPSSQYLAPIDVAPVTSNILSGVLADDGYRYKTVKKFKRRH